MRNNQAESPAHEGPEGSIFLPKTENPLREFDSWQFALLTGRGIAKGKSFEEIEAMNDEIIKSREMYLGARALK